MLKTAELLLGLGWWSLGRFCWKLVQASSSAFPLETWCTTDWTDHHGTTPMGHQRDSWGVGSRNGTRGFLSPMALDQAFFFICMRIYIVIYTHIYTHRLQIVNRSEHFVWVCFPTSEVFQVHHERDMGGTMALLLCWGQEVGSRSLLCTRLWPHVSRFEGC